MKTPKINPLTAQIIGYGLGIVILLWVVLQIMKKIGLVETKEDKKEEKERAEIIDSNSHYFDPKLHRLISQPIYLLSDNEVNKLVTDFDGAFHWYNDNEEAVYNVFRQLVYKVQVSQLADEYQKRFSRDLLGYIYKKMNMNEVNYIWDIIDKMK